MKKVIWFFTVILLIFVGIFLFFYLHKNSHSITAIEKNVNNTFVNSSANKNQNHSENLIINSQDSENNSKITSTENSTEEKNCTEQGGTLCKGRCTDFRLINGESCCFGECKNFCNVTPGQSSDDCRDCDKCYCDIEELSNIKKVSGGSDNDKYFCLIDPKSNNRMMWISTKSLDKQQCDEEFNTSNYGQYCKCGNYLCGGVNSTAVWNKCINNECLYSYGQVCQYDQECNSSDRCTIPKCQNSLCQSSQISECINGDGCCPSNCNSTDDADCTPPELKCEDGTVNFQCSKNKPYFCLIGYSPPLYKDCLNCGCPEGLTCGTDRDCH